jgi:hypothetical protein
VDLSLDGALALALGLVVARVLSWSDQALVRGPSAGIDLTHASPVGYWHGGMEFASLVAGTRPRRRHYDEQSRR